MISVLIRIILAFIVFSFYNALSIKGLTENAAWHLSQFASIVLFIFCGLENKIWALWASWKFGDYHKFGELAWKIGAIIVIGIAVYVESLHYFLPRVLEWMT